MKAPIKNINLNLKKGFLYGLCGKVGSGRSTLLQALLKQIPYYSGNLVINGTVSYCEQSSKIFQGTIRDNVIFGRKFDEDRYKKVLEMTELKEDIQRLSNSDLSVVGEKGIMVSGGQKARISLARALYSDCDIYLLDDPLSAVNMKVAQHIFSSIKEELKTKTVIFNTHQTRYLNQCDEILVVQQGRLT